MSEIGKRILNLLNKMNMSQKQLAELLNTSEVNVSRYISGDRNINTDTLSNIATALHTTTDYLLGINNNIDNFKDYDVERILARKADTMSIEQKKRLLSILFSD